MSYGFNTRMKLFDNVLINGAGSAESDAIVLAFVAALAGLVLQAASVAGTADVKLEYVTSPDGTNYEDYTDTQDITSSTLTDRTGGPEGFNAFVMPPLTPGSQTIKFRVTGVNANPADTRVTVYAFIREGMQ